MARRLLLLMIVTASLGACTGASDPVALDVETTTADLAVQEVVFEEVGPEDAMKFDQAGQQCKVDADCAQFDDGNLCNGVWACEDGECVEDSGSQVSCPPGDNLCTQVVCNPASGVCEEMPVEGEVPCDDGDQCTLGDMCIDGVCSATQAVPCNDDNPCTDELCSPDEGCVYTTNENPCNDGNLCTAGEYCQDGECQGGAMIQCNDHNPCTDDACTSVEGCVYQSNTASCDDGNQCTTGDQCVSGTCVPGSQNSCDCLADDDCLAWDDNNACNGQLMCKNLKCVTDLATVVNCPDLDPADCMVFACDEETGDCLDLPEDDYKVCDDNSVCTLDDSCVEGECAGTLIACDDANPCTADLCNDESGCYHEPSSGSCDDGDPCTSGDFCAAGKCQPGPEDACDKCTGDEECAPYDDGNLCNGLMACVDETCKLKPGSAVVCDTAGDTQCVHNLCDPATGECALVPVGPGAACSDGDACTKNDVCLDGECVGEAIECDDENQCTLDTCDTQAGCVHTPGTAPCDDGDACTVLDACADGACQPGALVDCDDGDACTADKCDPDVGCVHEAVACDDDNLCTEDSCDPDTGCAYHPLECSDGLWCTGPEACSPELGCVVGDMPSPDDGIDCTEDLCDEELDKYVHIPHSSMCQDDDECTANVCDEQSGCLSFPIDCDDGDPGTIDSCDPLLGCLHDLVPCDDSDACTQDLVDVQTGECVHLEKKCNDDSVCTQDSCDPDVGCVFAPVSCDDDNPCTQDTCDPVTGCQHSGVPLNGALCDDGDPCTGPDTCHGGLCIPLGPTCVENCDNEKDDDSDGLVDCGDPDCADEPNCDPDPTCIIDGEIACDSTVSGELAANGGIFQSYSCVDGLFPLNEQVFEFVADCTTTATIELQSMFPFPWGQDPMLVLAVLDAQTGCQPAACIAGAGVLVPEPAVIELDVKAGHKYYLVVDGMTLGIFPNQSFTLSVDCGCPAVPDEVCGNDKDDDGDGLVDCQDPNCDEVPPCKPVEACEVAADIHCDEQVKGALDPQALGVFTTYSCTPTSYTAAEQVYAFTAQCDGQVTAIVNTGFPFPFPGLDLANVLILDGWEDCGPDNCIAVGQAVSGANGVYSVVFDAKKGHLYYVVVDGTPFPIMPGNEYTLDINCICPVEVCGNGQDDDGNGLADCDDPVCADLPECQSLKPCEPIGPIECGKGVSGTINAQPGGLLDTYACSQQLYSTAEDIYSFAPTCSGEVTVTASVKGLPVWPNPDTPPANVIIMASADVCSGDACIAIGKMTGQDNEVTVTFDAQEGVEYLVVVDGSSIPFFLDIPYELNVECPCQPQPVELCGDGHDNDGDNLVDCADPDCKNSPDCPPVESCKSLETLQCASSVKALFNPGVPGKWSSYPCDPAGTYDSEEHIYKFTSNCLGLATITLVSDMQFPLPLPFGNVFLFDSQEECTPDACLAAGKAPSGAQLSTMTIERNIVPGEQFYLVVDGMANLFGLMNGYTLSVDCMCAVP